MRLAPVPSTDVAEHAAAAEKQVADDDDDDSWMLASDIDELADAMTQAQPQGQVRTRPVQVKRLPALIRLPCPAFRHYGRRHESTAGSTSMLGV